MAARSNRLHRPQTGYYDTLIHEAAVLFESLGQNHPFVDGNKQVAFAAVDVFLRINGYSIAAQSTAIHSHLMKLLGEGNFDMERLAPWLQSVTLGIGPPKTRR